MVPRSSGGRQEMGEKTGEELLILLSRIVVVSMLF